MCLRHHYWRVTPVKPLCTIWVWQGVQDPARWYDITPPFMPIYLVNVTWVLTKNFLVGSCSRGKAARCTYQAGAGGRSGTRVCTEFVAFSLACARSCTSLLYSILTIRIPHLERPCAWKRLPKNVRRRLSTAKYLLRYNAMTEVLPWDKCHMKTMMSKY